LRTACKTIRNVVVEAQKALAAYAEPYGPDAKTTISSVLKVFDSRELLQPRRGAISRPCSFGGT
jgi:hypothetical protein